jgi:hypothetical protein
MKKLAVVFGLLFLLGLVCSGCKFIDNRPERFANLTRSKSIEKEKSLSVKLNYGVGEMIIMPADEKTLYKVDLEYDASRVTPSVDYDSLGDRGTLDINVKGSATPMGKLKGHRLDLQLTTAIPIELDLKTGVSESRIDLSKFQIKRLSLESGVGQTSVSFDKVNPVVCESMEIKAGVGEFRVVGLGNANFTDLSIKSGVGETRLDFTGDWRRDAEVEIKMGIGELVAILPRDLGVEVSGGESFLSSLHLESFHRSGDLYRSDNYDTAKHRMRLHIKTGIGSLKVRWA